MRRYSLRSELDCVGCVRRYVHFHGLRHPRELGAHDVDASLAPLPSEHHVSACSQPQVKQELLFFFKHGLRHAFATPMLQAGYNFGGGRG